MDLDKKITEFKQIVQEEVFVKNFLKEPVDSPLSKEWVFDFRNVLMKGRISELVGDIFYQRFASQYPFQLCTIEVGGIPLMMSILHKFYNNGHHDVNAFFIRKSRKKTDRLQMIEGAIQRGKKIILVDDIMNSGNSFWRQIEVLEAHGYKVDTVWSLLRFRDQKYYERFQLRNIKVESLFVLDDFSESLPGVKNKVVVSDLKSPTNPFKSLWMFKSENPSLEYILPKSQPILDEKSIYVGSDNKLFWSINQLDGSINWSFKTGYSSKRKAIFSSPALYSDLVIFGAYDGNIYALEKETGKRRWVCFEADWVGSSPVIAPELGLVFVGMEFGLFRRHGGIVALNANTGKKVWSDYSHKAFTHSSPLYIPLHEQVVIGSNDGEVRLHNARNGDLVWKFTTFGGASYDENDDAGFGQGEVKQGFVYYEEKELIIFGATDGFLYIVNRTTGHLVKHFKCEFAVWGTPCIYKDKVYFTSLDKRVRCLDLNSLQLIFEVEVDGSRIFSSPTVIDDKLYVGTNAGRLHELDVDTGASLGYLQTLERITNKLVKNNDTGRYYLPTYANEIICLDKVETQ